MELRPLTYQSLHETFESYGLSKEELDELAYLIFLLPNDKIRQQAIQKILTTPGLINQLGVFIRKKSQFLGEINEPGWDRIIEEQRKILKSL
ncbi:MAG: hypothetical protein NTV62_03140 [Candidatus Gribaldobacteria bacterium]|nr:hypothetical protein [Candidatus Portnoybacteria bacterium]MCX6791158.1 hypothetical protein [Candidatus Gribaldobacteria bacterium]